MESTNKIECALLNDKSESFTNIAANVYNKIFNLIINKYSAYLDIIFEEKYDISSHEISTNIKPLKKGIYNKVAQFGEKGHPLIIEIFLLPRSYSKEKIKSPDDHFLALLVEQWSIQLVPSKLVDKKIVEMNDLIEELSRHFENSSLSKWLTKQKNSINRPKLIYRLTNLHNSCQINPNWISISSRDLFPSDQVSILDRDLCDNDYGSPNKLYYLNSPNNSPSTKAIYQNASSSPTCFLSNDYVKTSKCFSCARINAVDVLEITLFSIQEFPYHQFSIDFEKEPTKSSSCELDTIEKSATPEKIRRLDDSEFLSTNHIFGYEGEIDIVPDSSTNVKSSLIEGPNNIERIITSLSTLTTTQNTSGLLLNESDWNSCKRNVENEDELDSQDHEMFLRHSQVNFDFGQFPIGSSPIQNHQNYNNNKRSSMNIEKSLFFSQFFANSKGFNEKTDCCTKVCSTTSTNNSNETSPIATYSFNVVKTNSSKKVDHSQVQRCLKRSDEAELCRPDSLHCKSSKLNDGTPRSSSSNDDRNNSLVNETVSENIKTLLEIPVRSKLENLSENHIFSRSTSSTKKIHPNISNSKFELKSVNIKRLSINSHVSRQSNSTVYSNNLVVNFEESMLNGRINPCGMVDGFEVELGASGSFFPRHARLSVSSYFFQLSNDDAPSPYLGFADLSKLPNKKGYQVPKSGAIQLTLFNPNKSVVKMFLIGYDFTDMPSNSQTFLRHRTFSVPINSKRNKESESNTIETKGPVTTCSPTSIMIVSKWLSHEDKPGSSYLFENDKRKTLSSNLRYSIHLKFHSTKSSRIYLHSDIRMIFSRDDKCEPDNPGFDNYGPISYELFSYVEGPGNPRYSSKYC